LRKVPQVIEENPFKKKQEMNLHP